MIPVMPAVNPFPVGTPIRPETRQIGRGPAIDALYRQVVAHRHHTLLIDERRVGKTSMAWAILDRVRARDVGWAIEVNLARGPVTRASVLAEHLAEQARASQVRVGSRLEQLTDRLRGGARIANTPIVGVVGKLLGVDELKNAAEVSEAIDQSLAADEESEADLCGILRALIAAAIASDKVLVIFIDEVQRLCTDWSDDDDSLYVQEALAEVMEGHAGHAVLLLAGSERAGLEQLLADGQPMHYDGMTFPMQPISSEDWHHHLPLRFAEAGLEIGHERIDQILESSGRHPQHTMRVCAHVRELADDGAFAITDVLVEEAIKTAREHPSWSG